MNVLPILLLSLLLTSCGGGSVEGDLEFGAASSVNNEWVEPVAIEPSNSTRLIVRALDLSGAGPWSEPLAYNHLFSDAGEGQTLSGIEELKQTSLLVEWEHTPGAYGYELLAVNSKTGEVLGEHTLPAEFVCGGGSCKVQPEQPSVPQESRSVTATINNSTSEGIAPYSMELSAYTDDIAETAVSYNWTISGQFAEKNSDSFFSHTFYIPGVYRVKLEVTDEVGATAVDYASVTVTSSDEQEIDGVAELSTSNDSRFYLSEAEEAFGFQLIPTVDIDSHAAVIDVPAPVLYVNSTDALPLAPTAAAASPVDRTPNVENPTDSAISGDTNQITQASNEFQSPSVTPIEASVFSASNSVNSVQVQAAENSVSNTAIAQAATKPEPLTENEPPVLITAKPISKSEDTVPSLATDKPLSTLDLTAPTINSLEITDVSYDSAVVTWTLSELATGQVEFGTGDALGNMSTKEASFRWATHIQRLKNLSPGTQYFYRVASSDSSGNTVVSGIRTFSTSEEPSEPNPPPEFIAAPAPNVTPENWPANTNGELPLAGIFYGNHATGVGVQNSGIGVESSRRFRAERTGAITYVRYQNRTLNMPNITSRCEQLGSQSTWCKCLDAGLDEYTCGYTLGSSYHIGNGGTLVVELRTNRADGLPSDVVLGKTEPFVPMDNASIAYPALNFITPVTINEGVIYHLVFTNLTPPSTCSALVNVAPADAVNCPRNEGAQGLNGIRMLSTPSTTGLRGPYLGDSAAANFYRRTEQHNWKYYPTTLSWYEVGYTDGVAAGYSYLTIESIRKGKHTINGAIKARQIFTVMDESRPVDGLWLNFGHTNTADGSALRVILKNESGATLATASIPSSKYCRDTVKDNIVILAHWCQDWAYAPLGKVVNLIEGSTYSVEFSANAKAGFLLSAHRTLNDFGFSDRNNWVQSQAELSTDNGASWGGWTESKPAERDLSLLFTIDGMPRQLR